MHDTHRIPCKDNANLVSSTIRIEDSQFIGIRRFVSRSVNTKPLINIVILEHDPNANVTYPV